MDDGTHGEVSGWVEMSWYCICGLLPLGEIMFAIGGSRLTGLVAMWPPR